MGEKFKTLPGFRDFYPEDCARRNYLFDKWRAVAQRYGFVEYEGPVLESTDLYKRKSGEEIVEQLFWFTDKGERDVAMRPELTPTLARMAAARQREYKKPLKWFAIGQFFRYEKPQKGRTREFYQFNCDILGETSPSADAELVALSIDLMRDLGFTTHDFQIRLSDRTVWTDYAARLGVPEDQTNAFLQVIDKLEREKPETLDEKLKGFGASLEAIHAFIDSGEGRSESLTAVLEDLDQRGLSEFITVDLRIVRGLAYYTGPVFEVFDIGKGMRAVAGGGRYDSLLGLIGGIEMPATGFAIGDVVLGNLIEETPHTRARAEEWAGRESGVDVYVIVADPSKRGEALLTVQTLRSQGYRVAFAYAEAKVGKQFQAAGEQGAHIAVVFGMEYPVVTVKNLEPRLETTCQIGDLDREITRLLLPG